MISLLARGLASVLITATVSLVGGGEVSLTHVLPVATAEAPVVTDPFDGYPTLRKICSCESNLEHYTDGGTVLRGTVNRHDIGICQINELYHAKDIESRDINIYTEAGNIYFAKLLYEREGTDPWIWSKPCWSKKSAS